MADLGHVGEQVSESGVRQLRLALARSAAQDALAPSGRRQQSLTPERRLADADLALDQQSRRSGGDRAEELLHPIAARPPGR